MAPRAYMRADPEMFARLVVRKGYSSSQFAAFVAVMCLAEEQPHRGRFRSEKLLRLMLDEPLDGVRLLWGRWVPFLIAHGDLVRLPDGSLYLDGWDEWQEGDVTVKERMARLRNRRVTPRVTGQVTAPVTPDVTAANVNVPSERLAVAVSISGSSDDVTKNGPTDSAARARLRHMAYQRGDINETELAELRAADAVPTTRRTV